MFEMVRAMPGTSPRRLLLPGHQRPRRGCLDEATKDVFSSTGARSRRAVARRADPVLQPAGMPANVHTRGRGHSLNLPPNAHEAWRKVADGSAVAHGRPVTESGGPVCRPL